MGAIELKGLRKLHQRMLQKGLRKTIFPYRVNNTAFTVLFAAIGEPFELAITANAENVFILLEVRKGYRISSTLDKETYRKLAKCLRTDGKSGNKLIPSEFFSELDSYMEGQEPNLREPNAKELLSVRHDLPDRELPYFWHWLDQDVRGQHVTKRNLAKTRLILGPDAEALSLRHNVSSRWTDDEEKARNWKSFEK